MKFISLKIDKRLDIQALRGLAIIYIMAFHIFPDKFTNGFIGVDIFFVLSGFLITMILDQSKPITAFVVADFFRKRIQRIFPAYYLLLTIVIIFGGSGHLINIDFEILLTDSIWAFIFLSNVHDWIKNNDYFAAVISFFITIGNFNFLLHTWSLAVEMQFYLLAPLIMKIRREFTYGNIIVIVISVLSLILHLEAQASQSFSFIFSRLWQFFCGTLAFHLSKMNNRIFVSDYYLKAWKALTILSLIIISPLSIIIHLNEKLCRILVTGAVTIIIAGKWQDLSEKYLTLLGLDFIGDLSYSLYLIHWPCIIFIKYIYDISYFDLNGFDFLFFDN
ncbi:unnamed protein product [Dracunculus medinensis]|uniref:Acyl_transf_3 domain-containing protein n=1 Tax=Dracunculus medinensis TaxID=318479 RepID=A0A0N4UB68_DRAME|nr:unnamed protein product [Dracunculus medinensis]